MPDRSHQHTPRQTAANRQEAQAAERDASVRHQRPASSVAPPAGCWYADPAHRPVVSWCPPACSGPVTHRERASDGELLQYCDVHAHWRRETIRLPLVRRIPRMHVLGP